MLTNQISRLTYRATVLQIPPHSLGHELVNKKLEGLSRQNRKLTTTAFLCAQPPKKKQRLDPAVLRVRVERKILKLEREISRIESQPRQLIPIKEYELNGTEKRDLLSRPSRKLSDVGLDEGQLRAVRKLWTHYSNVQQQIERRNHQRIIRNQEYALDVLKRINEGLYERTVAVDEITLIPYLSSHMRRETPPNPNYSPPDGIIKDISKEWVM